MKPPLYFPPSLLAAARRAGIDVVSQYPNHEVMAQPDIPVDKPMAELRNEAIQQTAFDRLAYQRAYMREYMRKKRAKDKKP